MTSRNSWILAITFLLVLFVAPEVKAGQLSGIVNGKSVHFGAVEDWNENNYGFGIEYELESSSRWKWKLMANSFIDSVDSVSYMAGGGLHRRVIKSYRFNDLYVDVGFNAFFMARDDVNNGRPFPGALPSLSVGNRYVGANVTYLPRKGVELMYLSENVDRGISGIMFLQLKLNAGLFGLSK